MMKWHLAFVAWTVASIAACSSAPPKPPVIDTDAPPPTNVAKTAPVAPETPERIPPEAISISKSIPEENPGSNDENNGMVEAGEIGGVVGVVGGVPGSIFGGAPGGVPRNTPGVGAPNQPDLPDGVFRLGNPALTPGRCPRPNAPSYPQAAKDANIETTIMARCILEKDGSLACKLLKSHPLFEKPMMDAFNKAKLTPMTTTDGKPARVQCTYMFRFKMA